MADSELTIEETRDIAELAPLWDALHAHHAEVDPELGGLPVRAPGESWPRRRAKYERWLADPDTFVLVARRRGEPVGYAFVTVGPGHATWQSGERIAELETLSVAAGERGRGVGTALVDAVEERLRAAGIGELQVTTALTNTGAHRFYERRGMREILKVYLGRL